LARKLILGISEEQVWTNTYFALHFEPWGKQIHGIPPTVGLYNTYKNQLGKYECITAIGHEAMRLFKVFIDSQEFNVGTVQLLAASSWGGRVRAIVVTGNKTLQTQEKDESD
jgi:hypothetical protein